MIAMLEGTDLLIVLVVILLLFGAKKLPEFARGLGQAKREFERGQHDDSAVPPTSPATNAATPPTDESPKGL